VSAPTAAVIGAGVISEICHLPGYVREGFRVVALCDVDQAKAEKLATRFPVERVYTDWRHMLETERPDVVSVCTPNALHEEQVIAALEHGAHVLCEKPLATSAPAAERMFAAARRAGRWLMAAQSHRFTPEATAAKEIVDTGRLGFVYDAEALVWSRLGLPGRGVFHRRALSGGGVLLDNGVHVLDQALWLMGGPRAVGVTAVTGRYFGHRPEIVEVAPGEWNPEEFDVEDFAVAFVRLEGGRSLTLRAAWAAHLDEAAPLRTRLLGTEAGLTTVPFMVCGIADGALYDEVRDDLPPDRRFELEMAHWASVVRGETEPLVREEETLTVLRVLDAAYQSAREQREVVIASPSTTDGVARAAG
jgi:predicted dehydrogenase